MTASNIRFARVLACAIVGCFVVISGLPAAVKASQELVTSDILTDGANKVKIVTEMYKDTGEIDPTWDYYVVRARIFDLTLRQPESAQISIEYPNYAAEMKHEPQAGDYPTGRACATFGYAGISIPVCGGGRHVRYSTYTTSPTGKIKQFLWDHFYDAGQCEGIFTDYADYEIGVRVPQGAAMFAYVYTMLYWAWTPFCRDYDVYYLYYSFASSAGSTGADNFNGNSGSGVADAPDSGTGLTMSINIGGMLYGWTGGGDTTLDTYDRYNRGAAPGYTLAVFLYVNGKNFDLCLETWKGTFCSRNSGTTNEFVQVYNDSGSSKYMNIRVETPQNQYGSYELHYEIVHR